MKTSTYLPCVVAGAAGAIVASLIPLIISPAEAETKLLPFQGRLTKADGGSVGDGARVVEFKMYDAPTGGNVKWAGEVHKLSVNGGLVNTMLGSKASLGEVDFSTPTFLQITIDAQSIGQEGYGIINEADPPLLPRQSVVPSVYAAVAGQMQFVVPAEGGNPGGVESAGWNALFGTQDPRIGKIALGRVAIPEGGIEGDRIADNSLTADQLGSKAVGADELDGSSVGTDHLVDKSVTQAKLSSDAVGNEQLSNEAVGTAEIKDKSVTHNKLAIRQVGATVDVGGVALSPPSGNYRTTTSGWQDVTGVNITISTTGRPVFVGLTHDGGSGQANFGVDGGGPSGTGARIRIMRNDTEMIAHYGMAAQPNSYQAIPSSSIWKILDLPAGTHSFKVMLILDTGGGASLANSRLVAYEL